jgi:DNA-binding CsgD family transcriptional regulator
MTPVAGRQSSRRGVVRAATLAPLLAIQALCAVFFVADAASDVRATGLDAHTVFEGLVALALVLGVVFGALEMRRALDRTRRAEAALSAASGAFIALIEASFAEWRLTPAERDVALLAIKGLDVGEIAALRGAAAGTVRTQLARVYAKADVSGRGQLVSLFIEDLLDGPLRRASG